MTTLFASWLGPQEIVILLVIGVLLFGRKLPEVGRYLGKGIVEFKKGMKGLEDEIDTASSARPRAAGPGAAASAAARDDDGPEIRGLRRPTFRRRRRSDLLPHPEGTGRREPIFRLPCPMGSRKRGRLTGG